MKRYSFLLIAVLTLALIGAQCSAPPSPTATQAPPTATQAPPANPATPTQATAAPQAPVPTQAAKPAGTAQGQVPLAPQGTLLRKIQDRGKLRAGVKYDVPTFGYLNLTCLP